MIPTAETVEKLRKLQKFILEEPRRFNLGFWGVHVAPERKTASISEIEEFLSYDLAAEEVERVLSNFPPCGTVACLAGNVCVMEKIVKPTVDSWREVYSFSYDTRELACQALGISEEEGDKLFFLHSWGYRMGWPEEFDDKLRAAKPGTQEYAQIAVDRIEHYIQTGE